MCLYWQQEAAIRDKSLLGACECITKGVILGCVLGPKLFFYNEHVKRYVENMSWILLLLDIT